MDLSLPVREKKSLTLPKGGGTAMIDVEYERIRKKCFHCFRLSHEKQACPFLKGTRSVKGKDIEKQQGVNLQRLSQRQHNYTLSKDIMPLLAPSIPPGFEPPTGLIAPEVFEQMQLYMNCTDPEERRIREFRMKKALDELSRDSIAQRAGLRMEDAPTISKSMNKDKGLVFDFSKVQDQPIHDVAESSSHTEGHRKRLNTGNALTVVSKQRHEVHTEPRFVGDRVQISDQPHGTQQDEGETFGLTSVPAFGGFEIGSGGVDAAVKSTGSKGSVRKTSSWTRRGKRTTQANNKQTLEKEAESILKRKADGEAELSWVGVREVINNGVKENVWVQCRLDRAFGNAEWFRLFPRSHTHYLERLGSDHRPILTNVAGAGPRHLGRFLYDKRWSNKPEVAEIVRQGWNATHLNSDSSVSDRIVSCRKALSKWKRSETSNSKKMIHKMRTELEIEEKKPAPNMPRLIFLKLELAKLFQEEEEYWKLRSKNNWLQAGDKNTKIFHGWNTRQRRLKGISLSNTSLSFSQALVPLMQQSCYETSPRE
ncbi:Zinc knuckle CX2CX4HX4C protein [Raphanus sativus]|nr:Zinc knuckle CX2CX4HX4C protein [Raphanus sativus]